MFLWFSCFQTNTGKRSCKKHGKNRPWNREWYLSSHWHMKRQMGLFRVVEGTLLRRYWDQKHTGEQFTKWKTRQLLISKTFRTYRLTLMLWKSFMRQNGYNPIRIKVMIIFFEVINWMVISCSFAITFIIVSISNPRKSVKFIIR